MLTPCSFKAASRLASQRIQAGCQLVQKNHLELGQQRQDSEQPLPLTAR